MNTESNNLMEGVKAVILAGGKGTRICEESHDKPKPMIKIGDKPIIWHIMKMYSSYGINEFIVCLGYKGYAFKEYFANYYMHMAESVTFDLRNEDIMQIERSSCEQWKITLVETGLETQTGGRVKAVEEYVKDDEFFCLTYGDGVSDIDIGKLIKFHKSHRKLATVTGVRPTARFGALDLSKNGEVKSFREKPVDEGGYINGGFFVLSPKVMDYIEDGPSTIFEQKPLEKLAKENNLIANIHNGFWHPMDTLRDNRYLNSLWESGKAPWKTWKE